MPDSIEQMVISKSQETTTPAVETTEQTTTTLGATATEQTIQTQESTPNEATFDLKAFNEHTKKFGREFKEEKEIQDLFAIPTKYSELENTHNLTKKEFDEFKAKYDSEKENLKYIDLNQYIAPQLQLTNKMLKKYPDKDPGIMIEISKMDEKKMGDVDILIKKELLDNADLYKDKGLTDAEIKEVVLSGFNLDQDVESWSNVDKIKIAKAANAARMEFAELKKVEADIPIDVEKFKNDLIAKETQKVEERKAKWTPVINKMVEDLGKPVAIPDPDGKGTLIEYTPVVNDGFKADLKEYIDFLAYSGHDVDNSTIAKAIDAVRGTYFAKDVPSIAKASYLKGQTEAYDKWHNENHNDAPLSHQTAPGTSGTSEVAATIAQINKFG
jgi:hypothetical protein